MWALIYILLTETSVESVRVSDFESMISCFEARGVLMRSVSDTEHFPQGQQAVCIRKGDLDDEG